LNVELAIAQARSAKAALDMGLSPGEAMDMAMRAHEAQAEGEQSPEDPPV
jgi:hypothetical protein